MAKGTIEFPVSGHLQGKIEWSSTSNGSSANNSTVYADLYVRKDDYTNAPTTGLSWHGNITIDGETNSFSQLPQSTSVYHQWVLVHSFSKTVNHEADGKKSIVISGSITGPSGTSMANVTSSGSQTVTLDTIPRKTNLDNVSGVIGKSVTISFSPASTTFKHELKYSFLGKSGTILSKTSTSKRVTWSVPTTLYETIKSAKSGKGTLTLTTYDSGGTSIGSVTATLTLSVDENECRPQFSETPTIKDVNATTKALTGNENKIIAGQSTGEITFKILIKNYADLKKLSLNGTTISNYSKTTSSGTTTITGTIQINNLSSKSVTLNVTDSRDISNSETITISNDNFINYVTLSANIDFKRISQTDGTVKVVGQGNYFNGTFGNVANTLSLSWSVREKGASSYTTGGTITPTIEGNSYKIDTQIKNPIQTNGLFDYQKEYEFTFYFSDKIINDYVLDSIYRGIADFAIGKGILLASNEVLLYDEKLYKENSDGSIVKI